jgi:hypothetical protein
MAVEKMKGEYQVFQTIEYLKTGNDKQKKAYNAIQYLNIMNDLHEFTPILCGTIPLRVDTENSDLDIIMEVNNFAGFEERIRGLYNKQKNFQIKHTKIRGRKVVKANFFYQNFEFELFGQAQPIHKQYAYLHMMIEHALLKENPDLKEKVIQLKKQGYKTEPAFCEALEISGDSYENLIIYGRNRGIVK